MENQTTAPEVQSEQTESVVQNTEATPQQTVLTETELICSLVFLLNNKSSNFLLKFLDLLFNIFIFI